MSALLMNRDGFVMPADGWYQIAPAGEFDHAGAGVVQVVDAEGCEAMAARFAEDSKVPNFAGLLVDFDHFSLDGEKRSEAAGWIVGLENRAGDAPGLWAKIRWSDLGEAAVKGGRYRFLSPVWSRRDCVELGNGRVRPVRLLNAAVTNDPNLKGMRPLSNSKQGERSTLKGDAANGGLANAGEKAERRFKWVLGENERHCPSCAALGGTVHTMAEWEAAGVKPGAGGLFCQGHCHCKLVETDEASDGAVVRGPMRRKKETEGEVVNRGAENEGVQNRWSDAARAAALAVRRAKSAMRKRTEGKGAVVRAPAAQGGRPGAPPQAALPVPPTAQPGGADLWAGGTPWFDERTGQYVMPVPPWMLPPWLRRGRGGPGQPGPGGRG